MQLKAEALRESVRQKEKNKRKRKVRKDFPFLLLLLFIKFTGDGLIVYNQDDAMLPAADGAA